MSALRILALSYLASASVFVVAATLVAHPRIMRAIAAAMDKGVVQPALDLLRAHDVALLDSLDSPAPVRLVLPPPGPNDVRTLAHADVTPPAPRAVQPSDDRLPEPEFSAAVSIMILPDLSPEVPAPRLPPPGPPKLASPRMPRASAPDIEIAQAPAFRIPEPPPLQAPPVGNRAQIAAVRLKASLTPEMLNNFAMFLYVSKADRGPLAQRMYVFQKREDGGLKLAYDWAVSTGRERNEVSPRGRRSFTATPRGYYQFDPNRMYKRYHSHSWDQPMPHAMFFNWERQGLRTGLAIHSASGEDDIARLGRRASAGCVHLSPENAATLYNLIRAEYRGQVPRFAYNSRTQTMSNQGAFMHDGEGRLKMADGYKVLVFIEDYGGENTVEALF